MAGKKEGCHDDVEFITVQRNKTLPAGSDAAPAALPSSTLLQPLSTSSVDLGHPAEVGWLGSVLLTHKYMRAWIVQPASCRAVSLSSSLSKGWRASKLSPLGLRSYFMLQLSLVRVGFYFMSWCLNCCCALHMSSCRLPHSGSRCRWAVCVPAWGTCPPGRTATLWCSSLRATTRTAASDSRGTLLVRCCADKALCSAAPATTKPAASISSGTLLLGCCADRAFCSAALAVLSPSQWLQLLVPEFSCKKVWWMSRDSS